MLPVYTIDYSLFQTLNFDGGPLLDSICWFLSGHLQWLIAIMPMLYLIYKRVGFRQMLIAAAFIVVMVVAVDQIANIFKYGIKRLRPTHTPELQDIIHTVGGYRGGLYGTVSAHAATAFSIVVFTACIIRKWLYTIVAVLWALAVCYSRIYLGVHFPLDILFGAIDGVVMACVAMWVYRKYSAGIERRLWHG